MHLTHAKTFALPVSDQDRARDFHVSTLGFEVLVTAKQGRQATLADPDGNSFVLAAPVASER